MDGIKKYLEQFHAIVAVGSASNESEEGIAAEEDRALRRARYLRTKLRGILSTDAVYYRLSLGWNSQPPVGRTKIEKIKSSAEQRRIVIIGIWRTEPGVDFDSILTKAVLLEKKSLEWNLEHYSQFLPKVEGD